MDESIFDKVDKVLDAVAASMAKGPRRPTLLAPIAAREKEARGEEGKNAGGDVVDFREYAQAETLKAFPELLEVLIARAREGSYSHMKLLFAVAGVKLQYAEVKSLLKGSMPSLGALLLHELAQSQTRKKDAAEQVRKTLLIDAGQRAAQAPEGAAKPPGPGVGGEPAPGVAGDPESRVAGVGEEVSDA